ncbi:MAG: ATP-binding protein, partial [Bacteroidota bacterium]
EYDEKDLEEIAIPSQLIQPLIENAIEHGFKNIDYPGELTIRFTKNDPEVMQVEVIDNGRGMENSNGIGKHISRSQEIIKDRLNLLKSPDRFYFKLGNKNNQGVKASIYAPYKNI